MIAVVKRKSIVLCAVALLVVFLSCVLFTVSSAPASALRTGITVVIDAGHGGIDGGVEGANGSVEAEINLAIAKSLRNFFKRAGYGVVMTRENSDGLYGISAKNKKARDMQARKEKIESANADLVISVHQNSYPLSEIKGAQVFYKSGDEEGKEIARLVQDNMNENLDSDRVIKEGDYYLLNCSSVPSILVECGFLSNPQEEKLLVTAVYQEKVAFTIFSAIHSRFSQKEDCNHESE